MEGAILVMQSPLYARPEDNGHFKIEGVSEGHYKLRVFLRGNLVYEQSVDVGRVSLEVPVKVPAPSRRTEEPCTLPRAGPSSSPSPSPAPSPSRLLCPPPAR